MISEEDDIKFVVKDNNEYELRCSICNSKLKYPTSWHRHKMTIKHMKMEVIKTYLLNYSINISDHNNNNKNNHNLMIAINSNFKLTQ